MVDLSRNTKHRVSTQSVQTHTIFGVDSADNARSSFGVEWTH
jgi:hypothetical protein